MRSLISHGPLTTWRHVLVPIATTNGGRRGAKAPPPRWCCVARSSCSPPLPLGCASLRPGSWRLRRSGPGNLFVMTWTHAATGAPSSDAFAVILLRILQTLRLPYLSSVCHPRKTRHPLKKTGLALPHQLLVWLGRPLSGQKHDDRRWQHAWPPALAGLTDSHVLVD